MNVLNLMRDKHALVFKILLYFISSVILMVLLPAGQKYSVNSLKQINFWPYPDLVVKSDYYHVKPENRIKAEQKKIAETSPLYFKENCRERDSKLKALDTYISATNNKDAILVKQILDSVYLRGVIENSDIQNPYAVIFLVNNQVAEQSLFGNFYTIEQAMEYFQDKFNNHPEKEKIIDLCTDYLTITVFYDKELSIKIAKQSSESISLYEAVYAKGEVLVKKNEIITPAKREVITMYLSQQNETADNNWLQIIGRLLISVLLFAILMLYLAFFRKNIFGQNKQISFIFLIVICAAVFARIASLYGVLFFWSMPFALIAVLIRIFFDSRTALFTFLITILFCSFYANDKFQFIFIQIIIGMGTVFSVAEMRRRKELLFSALVVFFFSLAAFAGYTLINGNQQILAQKTIYLPIIISSLLILLAYPFVFLAEKVFGFVSDFTLMELCDLNSPLLRELSLKVPGTFQHSLQVANLAEEAVFHVGGNTLLVRAGAMYHDIGKIENPRYFTENQVGEVNPHNEIMPEESAKIIISHVIKGIEKAKEHNIPEAVIDFIRTHHGTTSAGFFLNNFKKEHSGEKIDETAFRYHGPIPFSKETAVLMMADGVEAASRSLKKYDALVINELVDRIIEYKIAENQFINAEITFKDITIVKKIFKKQLMNMYHVRIEYPR